MSAPERGLAVHYVRVMAEHLLATGVDIADLLERYDLGAMTRGGPEAILPFATFQRMVDDIRRRVDDPALGINIGDRLAPATHGALGLAAVSSASARELLQLVARFVPTRITVLSVALRVRGRHADAVLGELVPLGSARTLILEAVVLSVIKALRDASMGRCVIAEVEFPFAAPAYAELAEETIGCPITYDARRAAIRLPTAALDEPLRMADPNALAEAARLCEREIDKLGTRQSFEIRTRRLVLEHGHGFPSMAQVARRLHVAPRTLARKLDDEGTSFRAIIDDLRHRMALDLIQSGASMDEVAYVLGYTDTSNFRRAFRRWTGEVPSHMRQG